MSQSHLLHCLLGKQCCLWPSNQVVGLFIISASIENIVFFCSKCQICSNSSLCCNFVCLKAEFISIQLIKHNLKVVKEQKKENAKSTSLAELWHLLLGAAVLLSRVYLLQNLCKCWHIFAEMKLKSWYSPWDLTRMMAGKPHSVAPNCLSVMWHLPNLGFSVFDRWEKAGLCEKHPPAQSNAHRW